MTVLLPSLLVGVCCDCYCHGYLSCRCVLWLLLPCLLVGVRLDRVRGGRQKYKRSPDASPLGYYGTPYKKLCADGRWLGCCHVVSMPSVLCSWNCDHVQLIKCMDTLNVRVAGTFGFRKQNIPHAQFSRWPVTYSVTNDFNDINSNPNYASQHNCIKSTRTGYKKQSCHLKVGHLSLPIIACTFAWCA